MSAVPHTRPVRGKAVEGPDLEAVEQVAEDQPESRGRRLRPGELKEWLRLRGHLPAASRDGAEDLAGLAERVNDRETRTGKDLLKHARQQGEDLIRARERCGPRKFAPWYKEHIAFGHDTVYRYIKIAENWETVILPMIGKISKVSDAIRLIEEQEVEEEEPSKGEGGDSSPPGGKGGRKPNGGRSSDIFVVRLHLTRGQRSQWEEAVEYATKKLDMDKPGEAVLRVLLKYMEGKGHA